MTEDYYTLSDTHRWVRSADRIHVKVKHARQGCLCGVPAAKSGADLRAVKRERICDGCFDAAARVISRESI